jgi:hypothetical protein
VLWIILSPNDYIYHDLVKNLHSILAQVQNYELHHTKLF